MIYVNSLLSGTLEDNNGVKSAMNGETETPRRLRVIFRVLSVLTLLEGFVGFLIAADTIATGPINYRALQHLDGQTHAAALRLLYFLGSANVALNLVLLYAGELLWKLKRRGLLVLIYVLAIEFFYILVFSTTTAPSKEYGIILGFGLLPFAIQVVTAFPIVAGVLIFFAYRYLGIPARPTK